MGFEFRAFKERRQWALSSVSGPPCFGLCSCFARFLKNHKKKTHKKEPSDSWLFLERCCMQKKDRLCLI